RRQVAGRLEPVRRLLARRIPAVGEPPVWLDRQHLAIDHAVPARRHWLGAEVEAMAHAGLEIVLHQPLFEERRLGERAPDLLPRMRQLPLDDQGLRGGGGGGGGLGHWSILFNRSSRRSKRSRQNAP